MLAEADLQHVAGGAEMLAEDAHRDDGSTGPVRVRLAFERQRIPVQLECHRTTAGGVDRVRDTQRSTGQLELDAEAVELAREHGIDRHRRSSAPYPEQPLEDQAEGYTGTARVDAPAGLDRDPS